MKTHWRKATEKDANWIGSWDLLDAEGNYITKNVTLKWCKYEIKEVRGTKQKVRYAEFDGGVKPLILNVENCNILSRLFGSPFIENWGDKVITLYVKSGVKYQGDLVDAVRISSTLPKTAPNPEMLPTNKNWEALLNRYATGDIDMETIESKFTLSPTTKQLLEDAKANYKPE